MTLRKNKTFSTRVSWEGDLMQGGLKINPNVLELGLRYTLYL